MSEVFIVTVHYDYEARSLYGIFTSEVEAKKHCAELEKDDEILDGVFISREVLNKPEWNIFKKKESNADTSDSKLNNTPKV